MVTGWSRVGPGWSRVGPGWSRVGPGWSRPMFFKQKHNMFDPQLKNISPIQNLKLDS